MTSHEIRRLRERDLHSLEDRIGELRGSERKPKLFPEFTDLLNDSHDGVVFGLFHDGDLVGLANAFVFEGDERGPVSGHTWVHPRHRGKGLGRELFEVKLKHLFSKPQTERVLAEGGSPRGKMILQDFGFKKMRLGGLYSLSRSDWQDKK